MNFFTYINFDFSRQSFFYTKFKIFAIKLLSTTSLGKKNSVQKEISKKLFSPSSFSTAVVGGAGTTFIGVWMKGNIGIRQILGFGFGSSRTGFWIIVGKSVPVLESFPTILGLEGGLAVQLLFGSVELWTRGGREMFLPFYEKDIL